MDIRQRHFGRIGRPGDGPDEWIVDVGAVVRRLLLFDQVIMESNLLKEVPHSREYLGLTGF